MAKGKHIRQKDLNQIKTLRDANLSVQQVAKFLSRGASTIKRAEDANYELGVYKSNMKTTNDKYREKPEKTNGQVKREIPKDTLLAEVKKINTNLERLVLAWSEKPSKRKWL